ncbi:MAG TPA: hypothetical protein VIS07_05960 [Candidatus Binatia bacterium]
MKHARSHTVARPTSTLVGVAALVLALAAAGSARALTLAAMPLEEMTRAASVVVRARCIDRQVTRSASGRIESIARFEVLEEAKGEGDRVVTVRQLGGRLDADGTELVVPGAPLSEPGDEALLFLEPHDGEVMTVVGLALGYMPVAVLPGSGPVVRVSRVLGAEYASGGVRPVGEILRRVRDLDRLGRR